MSVVTPDRHSRPLSVPPYEWRSVSSTTHRRHHSRSRVRRIPCGRCNAVIQHDSRAPWSVVSELVNMHWEACPAAPLPPPSPSTSSSAGGVENTSSLPRRGNGERELPGPSRNTSSIAPAGWERKRKTEEQRKRELEEDDFTENVTATSVICRGCRKQISLDKRSRYYPGLWVKHKSKCPDVSRIKVRESIYCKTRSTA
ncbi:hypothetical protein ID866_3290 [Astraeus odoratus]|nr:hypothetical protein ID866_3290 [Astraeus odoratus]